MIYVKHGSEKPAPKPDDTPTEPPQEAGAGPATPAAARPRFSLPVPGYPARVPLPSALPQRPIRGNCRESGLIVVAHGRRVLTAGRRQMARDLRIHAYIVQRARSNRDDNRPRMRTTVSRGAVITALPGRYRPDDQPYQRDHSSDSHISLRKIGGGSFPSEGPRRQIDPSSTRYTADTRAGDVQCAAHPEPDDTRISRAGSFQIRCIVAADGLGRTYRAARIRGRNGARQPAAASAGPWRPSAFSAARSVVYR